jgi:hypothetical protein
MESLQMIVKKLSNEIIDFKKSSIEGTLGKPFKPFFKNKIPPP